MDATSVRLKLAASGPSLPSFFASANRLCACDALVNTVASTSPRASDHHAARQQAEKLRRHSQRIGRGKKRLRADSGLKNYRFGRVRLEPVDQPPDRGVVDVRHLRERRGEHRPPAVFCDEVGELSTKPALQYRNRLGFHGKTRGPG